MLRHHQFKVLLFSTAVLLFHAWECKGQAPLASCDSIELQIKKRAADAVKLKEPRNTTATVDLFLKHDHCLTKDEIILIYEAEYIRLWEKKQKWWKSHSGWIAAATLLVLLVLRDYLKSVLQKLLRSVEQFIYRRFSGSKAFRRIALKKYRQALMSRYELLHITFRPGKPLKMKEVFVPMKGIGQHDTQQLDLEEVLHTFDKLMIIAPPGSGKSILCQNICFNYGDKQTMFGKDAIPIILELHRLNTPDTDIKAELIKSLERNGFPKGGDFLAANLQSGGLRILFDGFDEIAGSERPRVAQDIKDFIDSNQHCKFLITCRTAVYQGEFASKVDKTLELVEFNDHQIRMFLEPWIPEMNEKGSVEQLMVTLEERPRIMSLARNPMMLAIIAYLYADKKKKLPRNRGEFYEISTDQLLRHLHQERNQFHYPEKNAILQHLALYNQDQSVSETEDRRYIKRKTLIEQVRIICPASMCMRTKFSRSSKRS